MTNNNLFDNKSISWGLVALALIVFWPIGIALMFLKLKTDKKATLNSGKAPLYGGIALLAIGAFALLGFGVSLAEYGLTGEDISGLIMVFFFIAGGIALISYSRKIKANSRRYKKYIDLVANKNDMDIADIAAHVGVGQAQAIEDLQKLIDLGFFTNGWIDHATHRLRFEHRQQPQPQGQQQSKVVRCPYCGADNRVIVGQATDCEYCDTPLA